MVGLWSCLLATLPAALETVYTAAGSLRTIQKADTNDRFAFIELSRMGYIDTPRLPTTLVPGTSYGERIITFAAGQETITQLTPQGGRFFGGTLHNKLVVHNVGMGRSEVGTANVPGWTMPDLSPFAYSAGWFFYGLGSEPEFPTATAIYRKQSGAPQLYYTHTTSIVRMVSLNQRYDGLADIVFLDSTGVMKRVLEYLIFNPGGSSVAVGSVTLATNVQSIAVRDGRLYYAERDAVDNTIVRLRSAVGGGVFTPMTVTTYSPTRDVASPVTLNELSITPDGNFAFMQEVIGVGHKLLRKNLTNSSSFVELATAATVAERFANLQCTDQHAYFIHTDQTVARIETNAPVATRDIAAGGLEVVQAIQDPTNSCPLVQSKTTHVRFFARIASSSTGETSLALPVVLYGSSGGTPLPGSPLRPLLGPAATTNAALDRTQSAVNCWTFVLPETWTHGSVTLNARINDGQPISETNVTNNDATFVANFLNPGKLEVRFIPTRTVHGTVSRTLPEHQRALDNLTSMLPAARVNYSWRGGEVSRPLIPFYCDGNGRYEVSASFDDSALLLLNQLLFNALDGAGPWVHYVALLPTFDGMPGWSGIALPGIYDLYMRIPSSAWFLDLEDNELGQPFMSGTAAQELAHNFGRLHVNCGNPDFVDNGYPYPTDTLSSAAAGFQGLDPLTHRLILRTQAKDFMSYCAPKWTSDYTWRALLAHMPSPGFPLAPRGPAGAGATLGSLVCGHVAPDGHTYFLPITPLAQANSRAVATRMTAGPDYAKWTLHFSKSGTEVGTFPVKVFEVPTDAGADNEGTSFLANMDLSTLEYDSMELVSATDGLLGKRTAGIAAPSVTLLYPLGGETIFNGSNPIIKWNASDPDNDTVQTTVRWSNNQGATWTTLAYGVLGNQLDTTGITMPGASKADCRVELITTDGLHSTTVQSGNFAYGNNPPTLTIQVITPRVTNTPGLANVSALAGESITLRGIAADVEDETVIPTWAVSTPAGGSLSGYGEFIPLEALEPGQYSVNCQVADSVGALAYASVTIKVRPRAINATTAAVVLDGTPAEPAWAADRSPTPLFTGSGNIPVRCIHTNGSLYLSATGIPDGAAHDTSVSFTFDPNQGMQSSPQSDDLRVQVDALGLVQSFIGNGSTWIADPSVDLPEAHIFVAGGYWSLELRISDARLGGWLGQQIGGAVHFNRGTSSFTSSAWPAAATISSPATWTNFLLGADAEDPTDLDGDGLPDAYERITYGTAGYDPVKNADTDGDGQSDRSEFAAGTDPNAATSRFAANLNFGVLTWNTAPCRSYTVSTSTDLLNWTPIIQGLTYGYWQFYADPNVPKLFYRITAEYGR